MFMWLLSRNDNNNNNNNNNFDNNDNDKLGLIFLPLIISNIGDGLAEPIGKRESEGESESESESDNDTYTSKCYK